MQVSEFIFKMLRPFRAYLIGPVLVMIFYALYISLRPYLIKLIIDATSISDLDQSVSELWTLVPFFVLVQFSVVCAWRFYDWSVMQYEPALKNHIAKTCVEYLSQHDSRYFQNHLTGSLASKLNDLVKNVPLIVTTCIASYLTNFFCLLIAMIFLWQVHEWFSILVCVWATAVILFSIATIKYANRLSQNVAEVSSKVMGNIVDSLSNMLNIRLFAARDREISRLGSIQKTYLSAAKKRLGTMLRFYAVQSFGFSLYQVICLVLLVHLHSQGLVTTGDFAMIFSLNLGVVDNLWRMLSEMQVFTENWGSVNQALHTFYEPLEMQDIEGAKSLVVKKGEIYFDHVHFCYEGSAPLFQNKSIRIGAGEKVGLVGYFGGGKSTFVSLILRLYEVSSGAIFIDNQNIREVTQDSLRKAIGLIPQDPSLFHRSLMENIRYGRSDASDEEVIEASKKAHAHDFIMQTPESYESLVGERGIKLSGGQRQRVAIARAILKNAPILILDEATSQLDSVTEEDIQVSLSKLMQHKTTIVIAHRLSTLSQMDRILVFDRGVIVESGTHKALMKQQGLYKTLLDAQVGGLLPMREENGPTFDEAS